MSGNLLFAFPKIPFVQIPTGRAVAGLSQKRKNMRTEAISLCLPSTECFVGFFATFTSRLRIPEGDFSPALLQDDAHAPGSRVATASDARLSTK